jgi:transposase
MACRQNLHSQHSSPPSFSQQRSLRRRQSQSPSRPHGTNPIGVARVSGLAQSGFNEVAHRTRIDAYRRATSQKPPDSQDLRDRVIDAVMNGGESRRSAARRFHVSEASAIKWLQRFERAGDRRCAGTGGHRPSKVKPEREWLMAALAAKPDITLAALAHQLRDERGVVVDTSMLSRFFIEEGISFKTYGPPRLQGVLFRWHLTVCINVYGIAAEPLPRWRAARPKPHKTGGIECHFFNQAVGTSVYRQAIYKIPPADIPWISRRPCR